MKELYYMLDEGNRISILTDYPNTEFSSLQVEDDFDFNINTCEYTVQDGKLLHIGMSETMKEANRQMEIESHLKLLRRRRERECFSIINRGEPWYQTLTEQQRLELGTWYQAWLNITQTEIVPERPIWLK